MSVSEQSNPSRAETSQNTGLIYVLGFKIFVTITFWAIPSLVLPESFIVSLGIPVNESIIYVRLLGAAYLALLVGYVAGVKRVKIGKDVEHIIWTGIVSNGLASLLLFLYGVLGSYTEWLPLGRIYMWLSAVLTLIITVGLLWTGVFKNSKDS
jgi:hypothetical protein